MEQFGFSGLWKHVGSTVVAAAVGIADVLLQYLNVISLPAWAHALVGLGVVLLASYKGKIVAPAA